MNRSLSAVIWIWCGLVSAASSDVAADEVAACGSPFVNPVGPGPFDYLDGASRADPRQIPMLEQRHFTHDIQMGRTSGREGHVLVDLRSLLRACPNHHQGLYVLIKYHLRHKPYVPETETAACYLDRATRFNPGDGNVHMLAGIYHARTGDSGAALQRYGQALESIPQSPELHYNLGLLHLQQGQLGAANRHAVTAYGLGAQWPALKRKLVERGAWDPGIVAVGDAALTDSD